VGFKIHKVLGYGFHNIVDRDPRVDWDQYEYALETQISDFNTFLRLIEDDSDIEMRLYWRDGHKQNLSAYMSQFVSYQTETGLSNIMLFTHIGMPDWHRYNDSMDYYNSVLNNDYGMEPSFKYIPYGIYPYEHGKMTYIPNGQKVKSEAIRLFRDVKQSITMENGDIIDFSKEDLIDRFAPPTPLLVRYLAKFFGVRDEYLDTMQSGLYEYWS